MTQLPLHTEKSWLENSSGKDPELYRLDGHDQLARSFKLFFLQMGPVLRPAMNGEGWEHLGVCAIVCLIWDFFECYKERREYEGAAARWKYQGGRPGAESLAGRHVWGRPLKVSQGASASVPEKFHESELVFSSALGSRPGIACTATGSRRRLGYGTCA